MDRHTVRGENLHQHGLAVIGDAALDQWQHLAIPSEWPAFTQRVGFSTGHGEQVNEGTGPLLWDVLAAAGAIDLARAGEAVHLVVRITGGDGYKAVVAMGEISPQFAGRPIQVAYRLNGAPVPDQDLRLIVPGDRRGGRSVRNVVRIDVE